MPSSFSAWTALVFICYYFPTQFSLTLGKNIIGLINSSVNPKAANGMMGRGNQMIQMGRGYLLGHMKSTTQLHEHQWTHTSSVSFFPNLCSCSSLKLRYTLVGKWSFCGPPHPQLFVTISSTGVAMLWALSSAQLLVLTLPRAPGQHGLHTAGLCWPRSEPSPVNHTSRAAGVQAGRWKSNGSRSYWMELAFKSPGMGGTAAWKELCLLKACCMEQVKKRVGAGSGRNWKTKKMG